MQFGHLVFALGDSNNEIVFITSHGIEVYSVIIEKRSVKSLRHLNLSIAVSILTIEVAH